MVQSEDKQGRDGVSFTKGNEYNLNKGEVMSKEKKEDIYALDIVYDS